MEGFERQGSLDRRLSLAWEKTEGTDNTGEIASLIATGDLGDLYVVSLDDAHLKPRIVRELSGVKIAGFAAGGDTIGLYPPRGRYMTQTTV